MTEADALPSTFELQAAIVAAARASGQPVLDAGRGQPNWIATTPRAAFFHLGQLAVREAVAASNHELWGEAPPVAGIADRVDAALDGSDGDRFLAAAIAFGVGELGFEPDAWVGELVKAVLGAGYPTPTRMLSHIERVLERYLVDVVGAAPGPPGTYQLFGTEGGAAAMSYVFKSLRANQIVMPGDAIAISTPVFTPYLQIPHLESFGFRVVELHAAHNSPFRFDDHFLAQLLDPAIKVFFVINPGNPDTRAITPERLRQLRELVAQHRRDLVIVADTVYSSFIEGFRGTMYDVPEHVVCVHSFSKNYGATGNRLGFIALRREHVLDRLLAEQPEARTVAQAERYRPITSDPRTLSFMDRLVADSREVALHNIAGQGTPDQVQMALFALASLMPNGAPYVHGTRAELARRLDALMAPLGIDAPGGQDSMYYALVDLLQVARAIGGDALADRLVAEVQPAEVPLRLARERGIVVLPGQIFDAASWDVRLSLASLTASQLATIGEAIVAILRSYT